uniref:Uncharacterized protein n=1 Tax=Anguilla anguilla TaxID=7936 RepID=A0A0E9W7I6_ANGAN
MLKKVPRLIKQSNSTFRDLKQ